MSHIVYLALGSNLGDRFNNLQQAVKELQKVLRVTSYSRVYETPPWGVTDQPGFLNACIGGETVLTPQDLLEATQQIEKLVGRTKTYHWGPRVIDIDILFYDDLVISEPKLKIPHPGITERAFVLVPLAEIAADFVHPQLKKTVKSLSDNIPHQDIEATNLLLTQV